MTSLCTDNLALALVLPERYVFDRLRIHHDDLVGPTHRPKDVWKNWYVASYL
jgi:hypothetical protein